MLQWDVKTQKAPGKGILGKVLAFVTADEEQERNTLYKYWQIWVKELNQNLRGQLFDKDIMVKVKASNNFCEHIDNVDSASIGQT